MRRKTEAHALFGGVTFSEIVETRGDIAAISTRVASRMAMHSQSHSTRVSTSIFDNSLPSDHLQKLQNKQSDIELLVDANCRDICASLLEDSLFIMISDVISGQFNIFSGTSSPIKNKNSPVSTRQTDSASPTLFSDFSGLEEGEVVRQMNDVPEYKRGDEIIE